MEFMHDVVIIGFGPTGMTLAGLLGRRGVRVLVIEKDPHVYALPRAAHIDHTGLRTLEELGCLETLLSRMSPNHGLDLVNAQLEVLSRVPGDQGSLSGLPASMYFYQPEFDRLLGRTVSAFPTVEVRRGVTFTSLTQSAEAVIVDCVDAEGRQSTYAAPWVVGCDGAGSPVRAALGISLDSLVFDESWLVIDLTSDEHEPRMLDRALEVCHPVRPYVSTPIPGNRYRFEMKILPSDDPQKLLEPAHLREMLFPIFKSIPLTIERAAVYDFHGLIVTRWQHGRVLLAGDAAHQMPPFLGQGMCSGLRDAVNLAWKLSLVIRGSASAAILETYESERASHVRTVVGAAVDFGHFVNMRDGRDGRSFVDQLRDGGPNFSLPSLTAGPLVLTGGGDLFPQPVLDDGQLLDEVVGDRFFVVGRQEYMTDESISRWQGIGALVRSLGQLGRASATIERWLDARACNVAIIRPDRYVLAAVSSLSDIAPGDLDDLAVPSNGAVARRTADLASSHGKPAIRTV